MTVLYLTNPGKNLVDLRSGQNAAACAGADQNAGDNKGSARTAAQWCPPGQDVLKVDVLAAFNNQIGEAAVGVIVQDHVGQPHAMTAMQGGGRGRSFGPLGGHPSGSAVAIEHACDFRI
jgi:hypothetical protein